MSIWQQTIGIPMATNCAPLVADLFLYSYEVDFVQHLQKSKFKKQKTSFNLTFRYMMMFYHWITLSSMIILMLFIRRKIKDTTDAPKWVNYLYLHLEFDEDGKLFTRLYEKRDDFDFPIVNFHT